MGAQIQEATPITLAELAIVYLEKGRRSGVMIKP